MVHASYCAPYPNRLCVRHKVSMWYICYMTLLLLELSPSFSYISWSVTVTVTDHHSNPNPRVLKIGNKNREENKMKLKSIIFKPDIYIRDRLATELVMLKVHNVKLSFDIWLVLYIYFILYSWQYPSFKACSPHMEVRQIVVSKSYATCHGLRALTVLWGFWRT